MKVVRLFLPGRFEDAYVYMGRLFALTESRSLRVYNLKRIVEWLGKQLPRSSVPMPTLMFLQNDWMASTQFRTMMKNEGVARATLEAINVFPQPFAELSEAWLFPEEYELKIPSPLLFDLLIYNKRLYVCSDSGFYQVDIDWFKERVDIEDEPKKRHDARCTSATARFGAVNVSCGDEGLFCGINEFGQKLAGIPSHLKKVADRSLKTGWLSNDLVNYPASDSFFLLRTSHESLGHTIEQERKVLTDIGTAKIDLSYLLNAIQNNNHGIQPDSIQYAYNSDSVFFVHTFEGMFYCLTIRSSEEDPPVPRFTKTHKGQGTRILSVSPIKPGLVIETDSRVLLFDNGAWHPLVDSEVLTVRTFPRSHIFQNMVAITKDDGVILASVFDDAGLLPKERSKGKHTHG